MLTRRSRFPDKGRVSAYSPFAIRITVLRLSPVAAAVRPTGCSSSSAAWLSRSEVKKARSLPQRSTTSHVMRRTARTRVRGFRATARVVGVATHCARQHPEHSGASTWGVGGAGGRGGEGRSEKVRGEGARGEPEGHDTVGGGRGAKRSARAQSATAARSVQGWGKKKRARAKRLIAQARRPRIKNAHSADQEIFKVAPQFGWMIFNRCKIFALLCYDRLGRPLQTFMSAGIPRPLASMTRQDMGTSAGGQIPGWCLFLLGRDGKKPPETVCAVFRHDDETLFECLCVPFSGTRMSSGSLLRTRNPLPKSC